MTAWLAVHYPHYQSTDVKNGTSSKGKRRYRCLNIDRRTGTSLCLWRTKRQSISTTIGIIGTVLN